MVKKIKNFWPIIRALALDGWNLAGITGYCVHAFPEVQPAVTIDYVAAVIRSHEKQLARAFAAQEKRIKDNRTQFEIDSERREIETTFNAGMMAVSSAADEARRNIVSICDRAIRETPHRLNVRPVSSQSFRNLRARIMRRVAGMSAAA